MIRVLPFNRRCGFRAKGFGKLLCLMVAVLALTSASAHACAVCGGDPASPMTAGMNSAIVALLIIVGAVISSFVGFFVFLWRRARYGKRAPLDTVWLDGLRGTRND